MGKVPRIPLEQRLLQHKSGEAKFLAAFELFVDDFFEAVGKMSGDLTVMETYEDAVSGYNYRNGMDLVLSQMVVVADGLPKEDCGELLYRILIEPFAILEQRRTQ